MRRLISLWGVAGLALAGALALRAQSSAAPPPSPAAPATKADVLTLPKGEQIVLELQDSLHTRHSRPGDRAEFVTTDEVLSGYLVVIPRGSTVRATLTEVKRPGRLAGRAEIRLRFDEIILPDGTSLPFNANILRAGFAQLGKDKKGMSAKGEGNRGRDAIMVATTGAEGALLGAALGGKKGAAYGGAVGAGVGLLAILLQRGPELDLPRGMLFEVELDQELGVPKDLVVRWNRPPRPVATAAAPAPTGGFVFPDDSTVARSAEPPIPDLTPAESEPVMTVPTTAEAGASPDASLPAAGAPLPPPLDPTLGDPDAYRMRVDVQLVMVEAFVRDPRGGILDNLKREDFLLYEDGVAQEVRHFSRDELPLAVALVVDRSGSVAPYMPELRRAAYQTLSQLKPGDQVALFAFASEVERLEELTTDRRRIADRIARIRAGGGTNIIDAVYDAAYYLSLAARDRRRAIILISDNNGTERGHTSQPQAIRMALEAGIVVYSIKTPGESTSLMMKLPTWAGGGGSVRRITEETGGEILDVRRLGSLESALAAVISRLKTRYTLGYSPTNEARDGAFRAIDVRLVERFGRPELDYSVHARKGYYAPKETLARTQ